jgi:Ca-activated chloride channel family protein
MTEIDGFDVRSANGRPIALAMQRLWLTGQILPVGARLLVQHTFRNDEPAPLEVVYAFMLPRDAALRRFEIRGDGFEVQSELRSVEEAQQVYEEGIEAGSLSSLARAYRDGVVNLSVGNLKKGDEVTVTLEILAGVELHDDGLRFRFPFALAPGYHAQARMIDNRGKGEIELPQSDFGDAILPTYRRSADGLHEIGFDLALRIPGNIAEIGSPSHAVRVRDEHGARRFALAKASDEPNRDLIVDVRVSEPQAVVLGDRSDFAVALPSSSFGRVEEAPRKIALVIDRSGSMCGVPMTQAKRAVEACLGALSEDDQFALVAFDNHVECFKEPLSAASGTNRDAARLFLATVEARGGTELAAGFEKAARIVRGGGDVLVLTDGQVMGTEDILAIARKLGVRIHCLGIGSASQDRFLSQLASSTGGVSRFVTAQERVDVAAVDLFASIGRPVAADITVTGAHLPMEPPRHVFAGSPWITFGEKSEGKLHIAWKGGGLDVDVSEAASELAESVRLLSGARQISDLESRITVEMEAELKSRLAELSVAYGLSSRAMSLVAVVKRSTDKAGSPPLTQVVPIGMPQDTQYDAYFAGGMPRGAIAASMAMPVASAAPMPPSPAQSDAQKLHRNVARGLVTVSEMAERLLNPSAKKLTGLANVRARKSGVAESSSAEYQADHLSTSDNADRLLEIASHLEPDGGVSGEGPEERALKTISAVLFFLYEGHKPNAGAFRAHAERLVRFLEAATGLTTEHRAIVDAVVAFARAGKKPSKNEVTSWDDVTAAIA